MLGARHARIVFLLVLSTCTSRGGGESQGDERAGAGKSEGAPSLGGREGRADMPKCRGLDVDVSVVDGEEGGSSDGVFFLGMMSTAGECLHACRHAVAGERESGDAGVGQVMACRSFTWKGGEAEDGLAPCVGSEGGGYTPTLSVGSVSGNVESEECAAPKECTVLEWRLTGSFELGGENRTVLSGRSCSICGWVGCEVCAPERACPSGSRVRYLDDPHRAREADVVLVPATGDLENFKIPQRRDAGQAIVAIAGESSIWWTHVEGLREDKRFDLVMGYSRAMSDMHASYVPSDFAELARGGDGGLDVGGLVQPTADIVHFASNCNSEVRQAWVEEVMSHVSVDSYGKCNTNKKLPPELVAAEQRRDRDAIVERFGGWFTAQGGQAAVKRAVVSLYRFGLAFENTVEPDYITEKLFEVMRAGAVPVYLGAPNWREFVPMNHSVIDAADFDSPEDLARFLSDLSQDDERYNEYHRWREQPLPEEVKALEATSFVWNLCRVCDWWQHGFMGEGGP